MRRLFAFLFFGGLSCGAATAHAQYQLSKWLHADFTYSDFRFVETGVATSQSGLSGIRGEFGFALLNGLSLSAGGEYFDGHLNFDGKSFTGSALKQVTNDYLSDTRAMVHLVYAPMVLSGGLAERNWYDNLAGSYRRRTRMSYKPIVLSYFMGSAYIAVEQDLMTKGTVTALMTDTGAPHDVSLTLGKGSGLGVEIGYYIPGAMLSTHLFARYNKWTVKASDVVNDGVRDVHEPDSTITVVQGGIGVAF